MEFFKPPSSIAFDACNLDEAWRSWEQQFRTFYTACELNKKPNAVQVAILLHTAGPEAQEVFNQFEFRPAGPANVPPAEDRDNWETVLDKFRHYCKPRKNTVYERYCFWSRNQGNGELVDQWIKDLRMKAKLCEFGDQEDLMIHDKIVFSVNDGRVKERLLRESDLSLARALDVCRAAETTRAQLKVMASEGKPEAKVSVVKQRSRSSTFSKGSHAGGRGIKGTNNDTKGRYKCTHKPRATQGSIQCKFCSRSHPPKSCPAYGKQCNRCKGWNHFAITCEHHRTATVDSKVRMMNNEQCESYECLYLGSLFLDVHAHTTHDDDWMTKMTIGSQQISFKLDTGAQANVLPMTIYETIKPNVALQPTKTILSAFVNDVKVKPAGTVKLQCIPENADKPTLIEFFVTTHTNVPLLGCRACESLGLVKRVCEVSREKPLTSDILMKAYEDVFTGVGELEHPYHIELKEDVQPVVQATRKLPYTRVESLKKALDKLERDGIVADVEQPTPWVNNLVITEKRNGSLRLCLDPKPLNRAIKREQFEIPTPEDVQSRLAGKKVFSVIDMSMAYWHVRLSDESSYLCTFHTPWGRKRFLRMPFGISSASEVLQKRMQLTFGDIKGEYVIADDIIIAGDDEQDHDAIMRAVFQRARERNVKFNSSKVQLKVNEVLYMGHVVSEAGLSPDPSKVRAIVDMPLPEDKRAVLRFLNIVKYQAKFIPRESHITGPLRALLKEDAVWCWTQEHTNAVNELKTILSSLPVLRFYDVNKPVTLQSDASKIGLGACLLQKGQIVAYASRALVGPELHYAQLEKELLAVVFATSRFHQYIYGKEIEAQTDHKPREIIMKKPIGNATARVQRMMLKLQRYEINLSYVPGKLLYVADALSRAYIDSEPDRELIDDVEIMVHSVTKNFPASKGRLEQIRSATADDVTLQRLLQVVMNGWPESRTAVPEDVRPYWNMRDEMSADDGLVFAGERIVIPESMRSDMLEVLHEPHMGMEKTKSRARSAIFWPGMSKAIEDTVSRCKTCLQFARSNQKEPMIAHKIPDGPFRKVAMDIMSFKGRDYLVVVDYYSKYPELALLENKTSEFVISHVKSISARHGIPEEIVADNQPFGSYNFRQFAENWGITVTTSSPTYAQSNGQAERVVQTLKSLLKKADEEGRDPYIAMLEYRNTPISGLCYAPAQLAMSRLLRSKLPTTKAVLEPRVVNAKQDLTDRQTRFKQDYDHGATSLKPLKPGDVVRVQRKWGWDPAIVQRTHESPRSYVIQHEGGELRRNRRHLRRTREQPPLILPQMDDPDAREGNALQMPVPPDVPSPRRVVAVPPRRVVAEPPPLEEIPQNERFSRYGRAIRKPMRFDI